MGRAICNMKLFLTFLGAVASSTTSTTPALTTTTPASTSTTAVTTTTTAALTTTTADTTTTTTGTTTTTAATTTDAFSSSDICPSKYDGANASSGCYTQSPPAWSVNTPVSCLMDNAACMNVTCEPGSLSAFFREDLFHTNSEDGRTFVQQLVDGKRKLKRSNGDDVLHNQACGFVVVNGGIQVNMDNNGMIQYSVTLAADGNDADQSNMIEFYVDLDTTASCQYNPDVEVDAAFWINQEDTEMATSDVGKLNNLFECCFFADQDRQNRIMPHNIVNMGEFIYGSVKSSGVGYGLKYKLQKVTFTDVSGGTDNEFDVIGGKGNRVGKGSNLVKAGVGKPYKRKMGKNQTFKFLSFGFEPHGNQQQVDVKCRIKLFLDDSLTPSQGLNIMRSGMSRPGMDEDNEPIEGFGAYDYYSENY